MIEGHCMKCKEKREMKDVEYVENKRGMECAKGLCVECGTKMFKILGKKKTCEQKEGEVPNPPVISNNETSPPNT